MWFKVDDGFCMNPKTAMLSNDATAEHLHSDDTIHVTIRSPDV